MPPFGPPSSVVVAGRARRSRAADWPCAGQRGPHAAADGSSDAWHLGYHAGSWHRRAATRLRRRGLVGVCATTMRTLIVADDYPWPPTSGSRLRLRMVAAGLARCGPVDLVSVVPSGRTDLDGPGPEVERAEVVRLPAGLRGPLSGRLVPWALPVDVAGWRCPPVVRTVSALLDASGDGQRWGGYELVWWSGVHAWVAGGGFGFGAGTTPPAVVDVDDLDDEKARRRPGPRLGDPDAPAARRLVAPVRKASSRLAVELEVRQWRRLYRATGRRGLVAVVCSDLDARRAAGKGFARVEVVPNGYPAPSRPAGRTVVGTPPTVLFPGTLRYPPNADGARWLVDDVAPELRRSVPDARVRLVGRFDPAQRSLDDRPQVDLVGPVPDMAGELARADLVVVPLRYGSGTRVKILEAFAHRVPVVSTTVGAEGLGVESGRHLLLADAPAGFAEACARLLVDAELRRRLAEAAHAHFLDRFESEVVEERVASLASAVAADGCGT